MSDLRTIQHMMQKIPINNCSNWLYHHTALLGKCNIITGTQVLNELKEVCKKQVDKQSYAGAIATLRKLHDVSKHPNGFYDAKDYEFLQLNQVKDRIMKE